MGDEKYLENKRTIFNLQDKGIDFYKHNIGLLIYILIFIILIPYLLIKYKYFAILLGYFPNVDLIATCLGYHGGPNNSFIWKHLYNPADSTYTGYISSNIINLFALLGVTFTIAYYTFQKKSIYSGWARAFIMLPLTYFLPSNIIIYYMNILGIYLNKFYSSKSIIHYLLVLFFGLLIASGFILIESLLIEILAPYIVILFKKFYKI